MKFVRPVSQQSMMIMCCVNLLHDEEWRERYVTWEMDLKIIQEDAEKKGEKKKALSIAKYLKEMGTMSDEDIAKETDLPLHEVAAL